MIVNRTVNSAGVETVQGKWDEMFGERNLEGGKAKEADDSEKNNRREENQG